MKSNLFNILKKEIRELFRDKKSLAMMLVIPIFIPLLVVGMSALFESQVNKNVEEREDMKAYYEKNAEFKVPLDQMKAASPLAQEPLDFVYNDIDEVMTNTMLQFCQGELTIDETIDQIVDQCNSLLDEYHKAND